MNDIFTTHDTVEKFTENLQGSGINYNWEIHEIKNSMIVSNNFDTILENGMYDSTAPFTIIFKKDQPMSKFVLQFNGKEGQYQNRKHMLREYLEDTISFTIDGLVN